MLATAAKRFDRPKRQLFIDLRTEGDSPLPAQIASFSDSNVNV